MLFVLTIIIHLSFFLKSKSLGATLYKAYVAQRQENCRFSNSKAQKAFTWERKVTFACGEGLPVDQRV